MPPRIFSGEAMDPHRTSVMPEALQPPSRLRHLLYAVVLVALVPFGSVTPVALGLSTTLIAVATAVVVVSLGENPHAVWTGRIAALVAVLATAYIGWQAAPALSGAFAPAIFQDAAPYLGPLAPAVSIAPAQSLDGIGPLAAPFAVFLMALLLARTDEAAERILRTLATLGTALAVLGLVQRFLTPKLVLTSPKYVYLDSITSVFVNRNTTATLLGVAVVLQIGLLAVAARDIDWRSLAIRFFEPHNRLRAAEKRFAYQCIPFVVSVMALLLTLSRGGIAATVGACAVLLPLLQIGSGKPPPLKTVLPQRRRHWLFGSAISWFVLALVFLVFGGRAVMRMQVQGTSDPRFCVFPVLADAVEDNLPFGTGFATFDVYFPSIRPILCPITGIWNRAHNVFLEGGLGLGWMFPVIALAVVLGLGAAYVRGLIVRRRYRWAGATGLSVTVLVALHSLVDFSLQIHGLAVFVAAVLGATAGAALGETGFRAEHERKAVARSPGTPKPVRDVSRRAIAAAEAARLAAERSPQDPPTAPSGTAITDADLDALISTAAADTKRPEPEPAPAPADPAPKTADPAPDAAPVPTPTKPPPRFTALARAIGVALCLLLAWHAGTRFLEDGRTASLRKLSDALWRDSLVPPEVIAEFAAGAVQAGTTSCRPTVARPAMIVQLAHLQLQDEAKDYDRWAKALDDTRAVLRHSLACNPTNGDAWARLAMVENVIADNPERMARLMALSVRNAPYEPAAIYARLEFWSTARRVHYEAARASFMHDLRVAMLRIDLKDTRKIVDKLPPDALPYIAEVGREASYDRARWMARHGIELPRPRL
ncbi:O-antigen ligase family protein [Chthonobacter albigriseus]|uniref:O-antigen ligase family protein n=1 Tax=Chthonobacter albigriseus TaxID=1683161 RepID=UPI0015EF54C2|nr:O-antigen ligase family protein [Chthonobacter albigriseus]